jgi:rSAM/selenodomain-associated transferase 1
VLIFLKYPTPGQVKTRLAASMGAPAAAALYRCWLEQILQQLQPLRPAVQLIAVYTGAPLQDFTIWHGLADLWLPQVAGHLGQRLEAAFQYAQLGPGHPPTPRRRPTCAIGTDCLELDADLLRQAFHLLEQYDVVLGPAHDGGYYLIGSATFQPGLFAQIRWSTPHTFADQLDRCRTLGCSVTLLPPRADIDTAEDWFAYCRRHVPPQQPQIC